MKIYTLQACEDFIDKYVNEYKGQVVTLREGCLGLGEVVLYNAEGKKSVVIKEVYLNDWNCGHTVRKYNVMPKRIQKELELI